MLDGGSTADRIASELHCDSFYYVMETGDAVRLEWRASGTEWVEAPRTTLEFVGFRDNGDCLRGRWDRTYDAVATSRTWTYAVVDDDVSIRTGDGSTVRGVLSRDRATLCLGARTYAAGCRSL